MNGIPDDLMQYLRDNKVAAKQKRMIRDLVVDVKRSPKTAGEYAAMYTKRAQKIRGMMN